MFVRYGAAETYYIPVTVDTKGNNSDPAVVAHIKTLTGFFFGGGDQLRIMYSFYNQDERVPSDVLIAIKETLLTTGGVVAGTSAGTDCQTSRIMISGGVTYDGLVNGTQTFWRTMENPDENVLTAYGPGGIGLFSHGALDTHFANRGRQGRVIQMLVDTAAFPSGYHRAFGVDENTALVVTGDWNHRVGTVIGERGMLVMDVSFASKSPAKSGDHFDINGVWLARLSEGDVIDLNSLRVVPAAFKTSLSGRETSEPAAQSKDIFAENIFEFDRVTQSLVTSKDIVTSGTTLQTKPLQFQVDIGKVWPAGVNGPKRQAEAFDGVDPATGVYAFTYVGLWADIRAL